MGHSLSTQVKVEDRLLSLRFDACRIHLAGEFAGNVDLDVACEASQLDRVMEHLRVALPDQPPSEPALGHGPYAGGRTLVFSVEPSALATHVPDEITLLWDDAPIGTLVPALEDDVPIEERVTYTDPLAILRSPPTPTSDLVLLAANRQPWWMLVGVVDVVLGIAVGFTLPLVGLADPIISWAIGGSLIAGGLFVAGYLGRVPHRQIWLERSTGRLRIVVGRGGHLEAKLPASDTHALDAFHHVRLDRQSSQASEIAQNDQTVYLVHLEGEFAFAPEAGDIHRRDDALLIGEYASEATARRVAAEVAYLCGLKILETGG